MFLLLMPMNIQCIILWQVYLYIFHWYKMFLGTGYGIKWRHLLSSQIWRSESCIIKKITDKNHIRKMCVTPINNHKQPLSCFSNSEKNGKLFSFAVLLYMKQENKTWRKNQLDKNNWYLGHFYSEWDGFPLKDWMGKCWAKACMYSRGQYQG